MQPRPPLAVTRACGTRRCAFALVVVLLLSSGAYSGEPQYPVALMNWMVEGSFNALIVDKSQQTLSVWTVKDGEPTMIESYRCSTGENDGDKWVRGDMRTPEGVYFFCSVIDGRTLPSKYGLWAFTTDYPNFVDRRRGKNGDGIWLHGRDKPLNGKPDSNGCIAMENQDLVKVSRFIRLQGTPLIVVDRILMAPRSRVVEQEREVRNFIESWRQAWESRDLESYMAHYSPNFQSSWLDYKGWKEKKRKLSSRYSSIRVRLGNVYLYRQDGIITAIFTQSYGSDGFKSSGIKILYLTHKNKYQIYVEDYHQQVDDPYPAGTLIARAGGRPGWEGGRENDFRIRLVSTDEPEHTSYGETETPQPTASGRGVVVHRLSDAARTEVQVPPLELNERFIEGSSAERLIVASLAAETVEKPSAAIQPAARKPPRETRSATASAKDVPAKSATTERVPVPSPKPLGVVAAVSPDLSPAKEDEFDSTSPKPGEKAKAADKAVSEEERLDVLGFLARWKEAWEQKDLDRYVKMYHPDFGQGRTGYKAFVKTKRNFFEKYRVIIVDYERVEVGRENGSLVVSFTQKFRGDEYSDKGRKRMVLAGGKGKGKGFRILAEDWSPQ